MAIRKPNLPRTGPVRFRLVRPDLEIELEGDRKFVLDMIDRYAPSSKRQPAQSSTANEESKDATSPMQRASDKALSIREFIRLYDIKKHTDYVLAFGYFLEKHAGQPSFTPADINSLYYEAKLESSNTSQMLIQNIKRGFVMEAKNTGGGKKKFVLTTTGEQYIEGRRASASE
jgi:hypothetical protein